MYQPIDLQFFDKGVHSPLQVPQRYEDMNSNNKNNASSETRKKFAGMVSAMDEGMANLTNALSLQPDSNGNSNGNGNSGGNMNNSSRSGSGVNSNSDGPPLTPLSLSMLDNTLLIVSSDNGGPIDSTVGGDAIGSSNYPFRGGKHRWG
jgi:arylsulfatase A-like enzyme